jgi:hypothetical protein
MTAKRVAGFALIATPAIAILSYATWQSGWETAALTVLVVSLINGIVFLGVRLVWP